MSRGDILVACGLVAILVFGGLGLMPKAKELDEGYIEAMRYSQKSQAHIYATEFQWQCRWRRDDPKNCAMGAIGSAFSEKGAAFSEDVKLALEDTRDHMQVWLKKYDSEHGILTREGFAYIVYRY